MAIIFIFHLLCWLVLVDLLVIFNDMSAKFECTCCNQEKYENEFYASFIKKLNKMVRSKYCKDCIKDKKYSSKPERKEYMKKYYTANREQLIENSKIYNTLFK